MDIRVNWRHCSLLCAGQINVLVVGKDSDKLIAVVGSLCSVEIRTGDSLVLAGLRLRISGCTIVRLSFSKKPLKY